MPKTGKLSQFDAGLGLNMAETWWELGKLLADREDVRALAKVVSRVRDDLPTWQCNVMTLPRLQDFLTKANRLLKEHYQGKDISREAESLMNPANYRISAKRVGNDLQITEPVDLFWAQEYETLLLGLEPDRGDSIPVAHVMGTCEDPKCNEFFVRSRSDQRYHSEKCRMRVASRKAYRQASRERAARRRHPRR